MNLIGSNAKLIGDSFTGWGKPAIIRVPLTDIVFSGMIRNDDLLVIYKSTDAGLTWSEDYVFTAYTPVHNFSIIAGELGNMYLAFNYGNNSMSIQKRLASTGVWSEKTTFSTQAYVPTGYTVPGLLYNPNNGYIYCAYCYNVGSDGNLVARFSTNYGTTWSAAMTTGQHAGGNVGEVVLRGMDIYPIAPSLNNVCYLWGSTHNQLYVRYISSMVIDGLGNIWTAVASTGASTAGQVDVRKSNVASLNFITGTNNVLGVNQGSIDLATDGSNNVYLFYQMTVAPQIAYYRKYDASTLTWGGETAITAGEGSRIASEKRTIPGSTQLHLIYYTSV
jgi:hypothetical protein